ncbi:MAG: reprolysin-like metallopeptidase, partial [Myxococcota bacterium]
MRTLVLVLATCVISCGDPVPPVSADPVPNHALTEIGGEKRTLRLAVAATQEHFEQYGSLPEYSSTVTAWVSRLNAFFVPTLSVELELVDNFESLVDFDGLTLTDGLALEEFQAFIETTVAPTGYDLGVGLASNTGLGGAALLGGVCSSNRGRFAIATDLGDVSDSDFRFHLQYFGRMLGALPTFNSEACVFPRNGASALEPGSGASLMGLALAG